MQEIYEKLGLFYLGKDIDKDTMSSIEALTLLKNKNFTTHAAIIGMTGSGKTGLGLGIIEEAAIDNIPSIIIDPKGDMGNLCFTDPTFNPTSFEPWVADEAKSKNKSLVPYAKEIAKVWEEGIESWGQDRSRVKRLHDVKKTIYTPGSSIGVAINIMSSLDVPPEEVMQDSDTFASYLKSTATSLLSLAGIKGDSLDSKEYLLLSHIITKAWLANEDLSIEVLIGKIIKPSFTKIGILALKDFYPSDARFKLATKFNALLASPSFSLWLQGDSLDIQKLLYDEKGKAKIAIFSIAHLNDEERMFFVTLLLNKYIAWMRRQSGTSALKTLLYMDEIFGFFPPSKNPPSKEPMLLLLKQARAFGVGIVLSTQNPVDLDYKGLSNIGTWFIGRLQTIQDINRVIDGLEGKINGSYSKKEIQSLLSNLAKRTFFLKSVHLDDIKLFSTRWVLSYLKGPLGRSEIASLMQKQKESQNIEVKSVREIEKNKNDLQSYQSIDSSIAQYFEPCNREECEYAPNIGAKVTLHFYNQRRGIDEQRDFEQYITVEEKANSINWDDRVEEVLHFPKFPQSRPSKATFYPLAQIIAEDKALKRTTKELKEYMYRNETLTLFKCKSPKLESKVEESEGDFRVRVQDVLAQKKEEEIIKLQERYSKKEKVLLTRLARAKERVEKEEGDADDSMIEAGISILGALFGGKSPTKIGRAIKKGSNVLKERRDMSHAQKRMDTINEAIETLEYELEDKVDLLNEKFKIENCTIEEVSLRARKTDIDVDICAIVWRVV